MTGSSCTYNTVRSTSSSFVPEAAAPSNQGFARTFPNSAQPTGAETAPPQFASDSECTIFQKKTYDQYGRWDWEPIDGDKSLAQCVPFCAKAMDANIDNNKTANAACISFANPTHWENLNFVGDTQVSKGNCSCNNVPVTMLAEWFAGIVPALEEVTCKVWFTAITTVLQGGATAVSMVGGPVTAAIVAGMQGAMMLAYTMASQLEAGEKFTDFANSPTTALLNDVCGNKYTPEEGQKVFGDFLEMSAALGAGRLMGGKFPPAWAKGSGPSKGLDDFLSGLAPGRGKGDKPEKPSPSAPQPKPSKPAETTQPPATTEKPKQCSRGINKRAPKDGDCKDQITSFIIEGSKAQTMKSAITKTCVASNHPQACAHYYSAIQAGAPSTFVCEDDNERVEGTATKDWTTQHANDLWKSFTMANNQYRFRGQQKEEPLCERDEWPPAYFFPASENEQKKTQWGQYIRWLPKPENGGAAQAWTKFCEKEDGGKYNGQRSRPRQKDKQGRIIEVDDSYNQVPFNGKLVDLKGQKPETGSTIGKDKTTTFTSKWKDVSFTRAVYEIKFDWSGVDTPSAANDWMLRKNPCWPKDIAPYDPGYVLLTNDPWYKTADMPPDYKKSVTASSLYANDPPSSMLDLAYKARPDVKKVRPAPERTESEEEANPEPPTKGQKPPSKRLELVDDRIVVRDDIFNTTRLLTEDEIDHNIEIVQCEDRHCSRERQDLDDGLVIPGTGPPTVPSVNVAIPTLVSSVVSAVPVVRRSRAMETIMPAITAVAAGLSGLE